MAQKYGTQIRHPVHNYRRKNVDEIELNFFSECSKPASFCLVKSSLNRHERYATFTKSNEDEIELKSFHLIKNARRDGIEAAAAEVIIQIRNKF